MVSAQSVRAQLEHLGATNKFFGRAELDELPNILVPDEVIQSVVNGFYSGGFATMLATDKRLLLVDKKPFVLNIEDIRYDMLSDVKYESTLLDSQISVMVAGRKIRFRSWRQAQLRELANCIQARVLETQADWIARKDKSQIENGRQELNTPESIQRSPQLPVTPEPKAARRPAYLVQRMVSRLAIRRTN